jgi:hypothetical protein
VNKQRSQRFIMERFRLNNLNEVEGKEKYHAEVSKRLHLWKVWTMKWKFIVIGKRLDSISKFQPNRV